MKHKREVCLFCEKVIRETNRVVDRVGPGTSVVQVVFGGLQGVIVKKVPGKVFVNPPGAQTRRIIYHRVCEIPEHLE